MSRSISNGFICMSFKKRLRLRSCELCLTRQATLYELRPTQFILRSCDAPFTEASNDGIKRLKLTVRNAIIPFIIKHLALD